METNCAPLSTCFFLHESFVIQENQNNRTVSFTSSSAMYIMSSHCIIQVRDYFKHIYLIELEKRIPQKHRLTTIQK